MTAQRRFIWNLLIATEMLISLHHTEGKRVALFIFKQGDMTKKKCQAS